MSKSEVPDWSAVRDQIEELRAVLPALADLPEVTEDNAPEMICQIAATTEQLRRQVIRDRISRDSFQEVVAALLRGHDPDSTLETLTAYLHQILAVQNLLIVRRTVTDQMSAYYCGKANASPRARARHLTSFSWKTGEECPPGPFAHLPSQFRPESYSLVFPLEASANQFGQWGENENLLGYLCMNSEDQLDEAGFEPSHVVRRVVGMLETLRQREQIERGDAFRKQLLGAMQDGVLAFDEHGCVQEMNVAAGRMLGLEPDEFLGAHLDDLPSSARSLARLLKRSLGQKVSAGSREIVLHRGEERHPTHVAMSELRDAQDHFRGLVANLTDLTPIRQMEEEIDRLDHLAALGTFAAGIAHEIRNPLAGIGAGVEYLSRRFQDDAPEQVDISFVLGEVHRLNSIVSDLLDYTHPRPLDLQWTEAKHLAERIQTSLAPLGKEKNIQLTLNGPPRGKVFVDPGRIEQVLLNLARNAIEASPQSGKVRLTWSDTNPFRFRVEDEGTGLSDEQCRRAFEPFFTTKGSGTGLGLYLSHSIVEQHGGQLILGNSPEGGASIVVEIPCAETERTHENAVVHFDH